LCVSSACGGNAERNPTGAGSGEAGSSGEAGDASFGTGGLNATGGWGGTQHSGGTSGNAGGGVTNGEAGVATGVGGTRPDTTALVRVNAPAQVDILFVVDNSRNIRDKQAILELSLPPFLDRLLDPDCRDEFGELVGQRSRDGTCAAGAPEFPPVRDLHVGIITSSLGDMGSGDACPQSEPMADDKAWLVGSLRDAMGANDAGFLAWDPDQRETAPGISDPVEFRESVVDHVSAAGAEGCGYEMPLEAWYRFLIDPEPPELVQLDDAGTISVAGPPSRTLLAQRAAFLRPNSVVAIVMLSDENDCSIIDYGQGWLTGLQAGSFFMPRGTSACGTDPNSACCFSCALPEANIPNGCTSPASDSECMKGEFTLAEDHPSLRCATQKRRFGIDLLQPLSRYVEGLSQPRVALRPRQNSGAPAGNAPNGLFTSPVGLPRQRSTMIFLAGIVGVPWQDISDEESWSDDARLRYLTHGDLTRMGRWEWILGSAGSPPEDALMYETSVDRTKLALPQTHPSELARLAPSTSTDPEENPINGHESMIDDGSRLQPACVMELAAPRDCEGSESGCECIPDNAQYNLAICEGTRQVRAAAYPSTRELGVLRDYGDLFGSSVVGSICAKGSVSSERAGEPSFGYRPVLDALIDRMNDALGAECSVTLKPESDGRVPLRMLEAVPDTGSGCEPCSPPRIDPSFDTTEVLTALGESPNPVCLCEIPQLVASELAACQTELPVPDAGFCYVSSAPLPGEADDVDALPLRRAVVQAQCGYRSQVLRIPGGAPRSGATLFLAPGT
jgi:hypothetical protein